MNRITLPSSLVLILVTGCDDDGDEWHSNIDQGATFRAARVDGTDIDSMAVHLRQTACPDGAQPPSPYVDTHLIAFSGGPIGGADHEDPLGSGTRHAFGQLSVPLDPGCYIANGAPLTATGLPSEDCFPTELVGFSVHAGITEEVLLISNCLVEGSSNGALVVLGNYAPNLTIVEDSTEVGPCEDLRICFRADDPDGDPVGFVWSGDPSLAITADAQPTLQADGSWLGCANVRPLAPVLAGPRQMSVVAYDLLEDGTRIEDHPSVMGSSSATLSFPIYVTASDDNCSDITYVGCFFDQDAPNRDLQGAHFHDPAMTIDLCTNFCADSGFRFAGLQAGAWCFCGDRHTKPPVANCDWPCVGNPEEICGGSWANAIYDVSSSL